MRTILPSLVALAVIATNLTAERAPDEPSVEQLAAADKAYARFGAKRWGRSFFMPEKTTDADLKGLPNLPFRFDLNLSATKMTDAGMKEIKELKNLIYLSLNGTGDLSRDANVTAAGLKELQEALPKCQIVK